MSASEHNDTKELITNATGYIEHNKLYTVYHRGIFGDLHTQI